MKKNKHLIYWVLLFIMAFSLPIGILGCQTSSTTPPQEPMTTPPPTSTPTPTPTPAPAPEPAPSDNPLAKITETTGDVLMKIAGTDAWIEAKVDKSLKPGDSIKTSDESTALILFFEGSTIELAPNTEIRISELSINDQTKSTTIELWQEIGKTKSRVEKLVDSDSLYQIDTPHGAAVARGSENEMTVFPDYTIITNRGGIWYAWTGEEWVPIPEGYSFMILFDGTYYYLFNGSATNPLTLPGFTGPSGGSQNGGNHLDGGQDGY